MVGLVLVSHSRALAEAVKELTLAMTGAGVPLALAAGTGENRDEPGTDAMQIMEAIEHVYSTDGVVVLMDMGSAVLSAETALDFLDQEKKTNIFLCAAPFVEGAMAAAVTIKMGATVQRVLAEAGGALGAKTQHLQGTVPEAAPSGQAEADGDEGLSQRVVIPNPAGLHARPAAKFVQEASAFESRILIRNVTRNKGPVPGTSLTSLMTLGAKKDDELEIRASGNDQEAALKRLQDFVESGMGDLLAPAPSKSAAPVSTASVQTGPSAPEERTPIGISAGIAWGPLYQPRQDAGEPAAETIQDIGAETKRLKEALEKAKQKMQRHALDSSGKVGKEHAGIFEAQALVLSDPILVERATGLIHEKHLNAERAWWLAIHESIKAYQEIDDDILKERAADLEDVGREVLAELGFESVPAFDLPEPGILLVEDLTPAEVSRLNTESVLGVICFQGSRTSHSAILLRSRGIPAVAKARYAQPPFDPASMPETVAIDGEIGRFHFNPDEKALQEIQAKRRDQDESRARAQAESFKPALTQGGLHFEIMANVGKTADAEAAAANGADGIGLLRTEFMFLEREQAPDEEEQYTALCSIAAPLKGKPVVVRTLDAGGDKELAYLQMPPEENPFLGVRAIRLCLKRRALFQTQLRAILRAAQDHDIRVMFPMIATLHELDEAKRELAKAHESLSSESIPHRWPLKVGMMMEVPSAALLAASFAPLVDFMSIGTNDLTQYTLAADRGNMELEGLHDPLHPAILQLIGLVVAACRENHIEAAVCGEAAADPKAAKIFAELGIRELSMSSRLIPSMKAEVRRWT